MNACAHESSARERHREMDPLILALLAYIFRTSFANPDMSPKKVSKNQEGRVNG
jgi:hypothetical protein